VAIRKTLALVLRITQDRSQCRCQQRTPDTDATFASWRVLPNAVLERGYAQLETLHDAL